MIFKDLEIWYGVAVRAVIVGGLFFFGNAVTLGLTNANLKGAFIVAGGYLFLELAKRYGLSEEAAKKKLNSYRFLILP